MRGKAPIDDIVRKRTTRRDPREERESLPPEEPKRPSSRPDPREEPEWDAEPHAAERRSSAPPDATPSAPPDATPSAPPAAMAPPLMPSIPPGTTSMPPGAMSMPPGTVDARLIELEPLLARGDWAGILALLGPPEKAAELPATLGLVFALAQREAVGDRSATPANVLAIKCMAAIYGVSPDSATALVLAKRLLRQNPASWRTAPAPSAKFTIALIVVVILIGVTAGSYLSLGSFRF